MYYSSKPSFGYGNTNTHNDNMKYGHSIYLQSHIANPQLDRSGCKGLGFICTSSTELYICF